LADIREKITFETSDAVTAIAALDKSLKGLNSRLNTFNKRAGAGAGQQAVTSMQQIAAAAAQAQKNANSLGSQLNTTGKQGAAAAQKITFGFSGLAKALVAREIVSALNNLKSLILEAAEAAGEFELAIARISNIAEGPGSSIAALTDNLARLSVELGRSNAEVAEAAYEALQNDLGSTVETMDLLAGAANNLALVTGGTLTQSVNALSSVLKAYGLEADAAEEITDQLFAAINKGRISLEELESSLGKITPLAVQLDISFDQVAAAMAAITQGGVSATTANTQLRNIFAKLIRPTDTLAAAFSRLGVESFQELIARSGNLQVALQDIAGALNNDERAISAAFNTIRAQLGTFNLLANEGQIFADSLEAVQNSAGKAAEGANRIDSTRVRESQKAWAEFNETLRQVGEQVLQVQTSFIKGINAILPEGEALDDLLGNIAQGVIALGTGAVIASLASFGAALSAALLPIAGVAAIGAGIFVAIDAIQLAFSDASDTLDQIEENLSNKIREIEKGEEEAFRETTEQVKSLLNERTEAVQAYVQGMQRAFEQETATLRQAARTAQDILNASFEDFAAGTDAIFDRIKNAAKGAKDALVDAQKTTRSAVQELEDFQFDRDNRNVTQIQRVQNELSRASETSRELNQALNAAEIDPKNAEVAKETADRLQDQAQRLRELASGEDNRVRKRELIEQADRLEEQALKAKVELSENQEDILTSQLRVTDSLIKRQESLKDQYNEQLDLLRQQLGVLNEQGKIKSPAERASDLESAEQTKKNLENLFSQIDLNVLDLFGETNQFAELVAGLDNAISNAQIDFGNIRQQLQAKLSEEDFKVFVELAFDETGIESIDQQVQAAVDAAGVNPVAQAEAARTERAKILDEQLKLEEQFNNQLKVLAEQQQATLASAQAAKDSVGLTDLINVTDKDAAAVGLLNTQINALRQTLAQTDLTPEDVSGIDAQIEVLREKLKNLVDEEVLRQDIGDAISRVLDRLSEQVSTQENIIKLRAEFEPGAVEALTQQLQTVTQQGAEPLKTSLNESNQSTINANGSVGQLASSTTQLVGRADAAAAAYERLAAAARRAAAAGGNAYHGGRVAYRQIGGPITRGQDTQLTATSPGEFIINSRSSRQFFSQLQAINNGQEPACRERGGPVTNIGDINVNVHTGRGGESSGQMGRDIATVLRRELRRNTSTLGR